MVLVEFEIHKKCKFFQPLCNLYDQYVNCTYVRNHGSRSNDSKCSGSPSSDPDFSGSQSWRNVLRPGESFPRVRRSKGNSKKNRSKNKRTLTQIRGAWGQDKFQVPVYIRCSRGTRNSRISTKVQRAQVYDKEVHEFQPPIYSCVSRSGPKRRSFLRCGPQQRQFCAYNQSDMFNLRVKQIKNYSACGSSHISYYYGLSRHCSFLSIKLFFIS